jgi:NAD(P)-dependent dehydrogenase (short-subunit alcohol dehydrogenase family)
MKDKIVLITGSTDGIGKQTALELARMGAFVLLHGKEAARGKAVMSEIKRSTGNKRVEFLIADLSSLTQVRKLAEDVEKNYPHLDVLVNNAGVYMHHRQLTEDRFEMTFAVNHLAHFLLTDLLLDLLKKSSHTRVVTVSSMAHQSAGFDFENLQAERHFEAYGAYANSKLANIAFTYELALRLKGTGITANTLHPGVIGTKLLRAGFGSMGGSSLEKGARTTVYLATSQDVDSISGKYFVDCQEHPTSEASYDPVIQQELWRISEKLVGISQR